MANMKRLLNTVAILSTLHLWHPVSGHHAIDCFREDNFAGGTDFIDDGVNVVQVSDIEQVPRLNFYHIMTSVKVCENRSYTKVVGLQVSYG